MELNVLNIKGKETGRKVKLSSTVFGIEPNDHAIYLDVKSHLANKRQGTHKSKERAEITGSTRKIKKQKERQMKELLLAKKLFSYTSPHSCSQTFECSLTLSFHSLLFLRVSLNRKTKTSISARKNGFKTYSNDQNITDNSQRLQRTKFEA